MAINLKNDEEHIVAEINMTPLIDIMLVLLIIFMVTSSVSLDSGLDIDLPKTSSKIESKEGQAVIVSLDVSGIISVQGKKVEDAELQSAISGYLQSEKTQTVIFEGDQKANLGRVIEIMDIAKKAGAEKFAIAAEGRP
jgi:biopolymer transport protein ExbD